jgi:hypothetical protein
MRFDMRYRIGFSLVVLMAGSAVAQAPARTDAPGETPKITTGNYQAPPELPPDSGGRQPRPNALEMAQSLERFCLRAGRDFANTPRLLGSQPGWFDMVRQMDETKVKSSQRPGSMWRHATPFYVLLIGPLQGIAERHQACSVATSNESLSELARAGIALWGAPDRQYFPQKIIRWPVAGSPGRYIILIPGLGSEHNAGLAVIEVKAS